MTPVSHRRFSLSPTAAWWIAALLLAMSGCTLKSPSEQIGRPGEQPSPGETADSRESAEDDGPQRRVTTDRSHQPGELRERVAVVDGEVVTRHDFETYMNLLPEYARVRYRTLEARQSLLETVIQTEAMADIAERRGLGDSPEARYAMQHELTRQALKRAVEREVSMAEIDDEAIQTYFDQHPTEYRKPERRRLAVLVTGSKSRAAAVREAFTANHPPSSTAQKHPDTATKNRVNEFRKLAARRSIDRELISRGGDPGLLYPPSEVRGEAEETTLVGSQQLRRTWAEIAFDLSSTGDLSSVFRCDRDERPTNAVKRRWCVAMLIEIKPPEKPSADDVSRDIRSKLYNRRVEALRTSMLEEWRRQADVTVDQSWAEGATPPPADRPRLEEIPLETVQTIRHDRDDKD